MSFIIYYRYFLFYFILFYLFIYFINAFVRVFDDLYTVGPLDALDLTFLRPKFILVRVDDKLDQHLDITDYHYASLHIEGAFLH